MSTINPAARAAQEQARRANGEFGNQQHTAPEAQEPPRPHPDAVSVHGRQVWVGDWYDDANPDGDGLPRWPDGMAEPSVSWEHSDSGGIEIALDWDDPDRGPQHAWFSRGAGEYDEVVSTFDVGDDLDYLDHDQQEQVRNYGGVVLQRARDVVGVVETSASANDPYVRRDINRLITPRPFTEEERLHAEAELNVTKACDEAGLAGVMPGVIGVLQDREELSDEEAAQLTAADITDMWECIAPAFDQLDRDRR